MQTPERPSSEQVDREWSMVTETIRREVQEGNPEVIAGLRGILRCPLRETLVRETVPALGDRVIRLTDRFRSSLGAFLEEEAVDDAVLRPDLRSATEGFPSAISGSRAERIARRYAMARDLKLLALAAELDGGLPPPDAEGRRRLESGTTVVIHPGKEAELAPLLLDPAQWDRRVQMKDRVYIAAFREGKLLILKERKTARHLDTRKGGHADGLSSREEYEVGRRFHEQGGVRKDGLRLEWEEPVGYVEFPDGYSLAAFECAEGMREWQDVPALAARICAHRERFAEEYARVEKRARRLRFDERVDAEGRRKLGLRRLLLPVTTPAVEEAFTFEQFALVKAARLAERGRELFQESLDRLGYENEDGNIGVAALPVGDEPEARFLGYDVEYFRPSDAPVSERERREDLVRAIDISASHGMSRSYDGNGERCPATPLQRAAYLAILEEEKAAAKR